MQQGKEPKEGERRLYLAIEATSELAISKAKKEITRLIKEELVRLVSGSVCVCVCVPMLICRCGTVEPLMTDHFPTKTFFTKTSSFQFLFLQTTPLLLDFQNGQLSGVLLYVCQTFLPSFIIAFVL